MEERVIKWRVKECSLCNCKPVFHVKFFGLNDLGYFICPSCGTQTGYYNMAWLAGEAWNNGQFIDSQLSLLDLE